eukprot:CAMPEP_0175648046 /NCGR_PEP_ID=MMETSP0097-20121207/8135_1 /TAXON_ID=311494 /ORGANISM="Alexandrium monilatum, Strain CCMP3105" /LENGTH=809 /DNA_ID=CAMNT_0016953963 /DNA_START=42 /DNA_END=2471 /DNA_ORIENTATION=+
MAVPQAWASADGPQPGVVEQLGVLEDVSPVCKADLRKYLLCQAVSGLYGVCSARQLLNSTAPAAPARLASSSGDEDERMRVCQQKCERVAGGMVNETVQGPCPPEYQSMHGFSAPLNIFTVGGLDVRRNLTTMSIMPMPNMKGIGGPSLISYGQPSKCAEIRTAQYCVLSGQMSASQFGVQSTFALGNCLPRSCGEEELERTLEQLEDGLLKHRLNLHIQCGLVEPTGAEPTGALKRVEDMLGWGGTPVTFPNKIPTKPGFWVMAAICVLILLLIAAGTALEWRREAKRRSLSLLGDDLREVGLAGQADPAGDEALSQPPASGVEAFLGHWSLLRNGRSFLRSRPAAQDPFPCIDAVRALAMGQVIVGHAYVFAVGSAGLSKQFNPPYGLLGTYWFQVVTGCFYGVDSFFVLSGLLCSYGLGQKVFSKPESRSPGRFILMYVRFVVSRWLRLVPLEMFCIFFCLYMLPQMGSGLLWNMDLPQGRHCFDTTGATSGCESMWWTNLLFIQDLDQYLNKCFPITWYLAVDFQLHLTAPFFSLIYSVDRRLGWALLMAAMTTCVTISMVMTHDFGWVPEILAGSMKHYSEKFYFKPWCRAPAFLVGIALGWLWPSFLERYKGRHETIRGRFCSFLLALLGIFLCCVATFGRAAFFQCDILSCMDMERSPVSRWLQYLWGGFSILTWCVGLGIVMVLCFQGRFLPLFQDFLCLEVWQPIAKLTYAAYLIHTGVITLNYCQRDRPVDWSASGFTYNCVSFIVVSLAAAFCLWIAVEKPLANLQGGSWAADEAEVGDFETGPSAQRTICARPLAPD